MSKNKILVALSGGIDSAATVLMLRKDGYDVTGLYIDMLGTEKARNQAITVATKLGIELVIENIVEQFQHKIIDYTLAEHQAGRTPSPCAMCNPIIKWAITEQVADRLGIYHFATGHYVRIIDAAIHKGIDPTKDQSYYLWGVTPQTLRRAICPLGGYTKQQVRAYLHSHEGFDTLASGGESMSICFIGKTPYNEFLNNNLAVTEGEVVDTDGTAIGKHSGYQLYTIGQKRGFTGGGAILNIDTRNNRITTTTDQSKLYTDKITVRNYVIHHHSSSPLHIKIRGLGRNPNSTIQSMVQQSDSTMLIVLTQADAWAVADGQPVVFYCDDMVVGGGIATIGKLY